MVLTLYFNPLSQPSRTIWIFCKVTGIGIVEKQVDIVAGEHKKPWFLKLNPMGQVPTIKDNDFVLSESVAIIKYLIGTNDVDDQWYPVDLKRRAKIDEFLAWHHVGLRKKIFDVVFNEALGPLVFGKPLDKVKLEEDIKEMNKTLLFLQTHMLGDKDYLCGDEITIADLFALTEIIQSNMSGRDILKDFPKLRQWFDLCRATLTPVFEEVHGALYQFRDQMIAKQKEEKREEKVKQIREVRRRESTDPEGEVITLELDDNLNVKPDAKQNGDSIKEEEKNAGLYENFNGEAANEASVNVGGD